MAGALRKLCGDVREVAGAVLRAEAAAHVLAHDAHLVLRQAERLGHLLAHAPDELCRDVDDERVAFPLAHRLVRLQRVVHHGLRAVRRLDDDVRLREALCDVAARVLARILQQLLALDCELGVEQRLQDVPFDVDERERGARLAERVGGDRGDRLALVVRLAREGFDRVRLQHGAHAGRLRRAREIDALDARAGVRGAQHGRVQHPGQLDVGGVARLAGRALDPVLAARGPADDGLRSIGPLLEWILLDDEPDLLIAAFDFLLRADQSCHVRIASSIFGYVPQRQRLPAIACRISSSFGFGFASTSAAAETI